MIMFILQQLEFESLNTSFMDLPAVAIVAIIAVVVVVVVMILLQTLPSLDPHSSPRMLKATRVFVMVEVCVP